MRTRNIFILVAVIVGVFLALITSADRTLAQSGGQNPTPIVITLTPAGQPTVTPSPTAGGSLPPDRFEPNDDPDSATTIGWGLERDLTLSGKDLDYFTAYLKAGQIVQAGTTVYEGLDTRLKLYWDGHLAAENDDRSPSDVSSLLTFTAPADGWYVLLVERATVYEGMYDLETTLAQPTATPTSAPTITPAPTLTPMPTPTPLPSPTPLMQPDSAEPNDSPEAARPVTPGVRGTYSVGAGDVDYFTFIAKAGRRYACETVTGQVDTLLTVFSGPAVIGINDDRSAGRVDSYLEWMSVEEQAVVVKVEARGGSFGQYEFVCQDVAPPAGPTSSPGGTTPTGSSPPSAGSGPLLIPTVITTTDRISLTVQHLGRIQPQTAVQPTHIRLLVYYDANNDRQPGPGEGLAGVSVLAVDARGQRLARVFTNAQGEAIFNLASRSIARVIVPFVPGWSARVRMGEANDEIVLGLPAVRLPVFLPVQNLTAEEE